MKFFDKKGIGKKEIAGAVVLLIVAIIILPFFTNLNSFITGKSEIEICRTSVAAASYQIPGLLGGALETTNPIAIDCPKRKLFVGEEGVTGDVEIDFDANIREKELKNLILDEMVSCWWRFGEGTQKVYEASVESRGNDAHTNSVCFKCAEIFFDQGETRITNFYHYAADTLRPSKKDTYMKYITGSDKFSGLPDGIIDKDMNHQWSVLFVINEVTQRADLLKKPGMPIVDCTSTHYDYPNPARSDSKGLPILYDVGEDKKKIACTGSIPNSPLGGITLGRNYPGGRNSITGTSFLYPFTVRVIPTQNIFDEGQCKSIY